MDNRLITPVEKVHQRLILVFRISTGRSKLTDKFLKLKDTCYMIMTGIYLMDTVNIMNVSALIMYHILAAYLYTGNIIHEI